MMSVYRLTYEAHNYRAFYELIGQDAADVVIRFQKMFPTHELVSIVETDDYRWVRYQEPSHPIIKLPVEPMLNEAGVDPRAWDDKP